MSRLPSRVQGLSTLYHDPLPCGHLDSACEGEASVRLMLIRPSARTTGSETAYIQAPHTPAAVPAGVVKAAAVRPRTPDAGDAWAVFHADHSSQYDLRAERDTCGTQDC